MCAMRLVLATGNAGKLKELRELLARRALGRALPAPPREPAGRAVFAPTGREVFAQQPPPAEPGTMPAALASQGGATSGSIA